MMKFRIMHRLPNEFIVSSAIVETSNEDIHRRAKNGNHMLAALDRMGGIFYEEINEDLPLGEEKIVDGKIVIE